MNFAEEKTISQDLDAPFQPFAETFFCEGCSKPLPIYVQPLHLQESIHCPRCDHPLTGMIRRAIQEHIKQNQPF